MAPFVLALGLPACDQAITPIAPTEMVYSIYGHLDVSADTQWVHIAPFRTSIFSTPDPVDAVVTIEEMGTGRTIQTVPALFSQLAGNFGDNLFAFNFRATELIDPEGTYRLSARRSDGAVTTSTVRTPPAFDPDIPVAVGIVQLQGRGFLNYIRFHIPPQAHVAMVQSRSFYAPENECPVLFRYNPLPSPPPLEEGGAYHVDLRPPEGRPPLYCSFDRREVRIVLSGDAWPFEGINDYRNVNSYSNIENGVGFLGGVLTRSLPVEECTLVGTERPEFCELYYGRTTATLFVKPINASGFPEEYPVAPEDYPYSFDMDLRRGEESWTRLGTNTDPDDFTSPRRFPGLYPGRYHLRVEGEVGFYSLYCEERTLDLGPGETSIDILMTIPEFDPNEPVNANGCREG